MNNWIVKKKDSGEYFTVLSKCSDGNCKVIGGSGTIQTLHEDTLKKDYDPTEVDYSQYSKVICELFKSNTELRKLGDVIARRTTPDYYTPGTLVYFLNPTFCGDNKGYSGYGSYYGPEATYKIIGIVKDRDTSGLWWVCIARWRGKTEKKEDPSDYYYGSDYRLPMYIDALAPGDVYHEVKRYDMPF